MVIMTVHQKKKTFRLLKDKDEREKWSKVIPRDNIPDSKHTVVCETHWPQGYESAQCNGKEPPSVFNCIKPSLLRTSTPALRTTARTSFEVRTQQSDELSAFNKEDKITNYENFKSDILHHTFGCLAVVSKSKTEIYLQCDKLLEGTGIFKFMIKIKEDFSYEAFHSGIKCIISSLSQNRITQLTRWSQVDEAVRFLKNHSSIRKRDCVAPASFSNGCQKRW